MPLLTVLILKEFGLVRCLGLDSWRKKLLTFKEWLSNIIITMDARITI